MTAVVVHLSDGRDVQATMQNGLWQAWWPEGQTGSPTISFTTSDGVQHGPIG